MVLMGYSIGVLKRCAMGCSKGTPGYSTGTQRVLQGPQGVLKGYSQGVLQGPQGVLNGYSRVSKPAGTGACSCAVGTFDRNVCKGNASKYPLRPPTVLERR